MIKTAYKIQFQKHRWEVSYLENCCLQMPSDLWILSYLNKILYKTKFFYDVKQWFSTWISWKPGVLRVIILLIRRIPQSNSEIFSGVHLEKVWGTLPKSIDRSVNANVFVALVDTLLVLLLEKST